MTSYFNACDVTVANSNHKICYNFFSTCTCAPPTLKKVPPPMKVTRITIDCDECSTYWQYKNHRKENTATIICDILKHCQENFVIEIKPISWSCPDPIFFKNEYSNPILIQQNRKYPAAVMESRDASRDPFFEVSVSVSKVSGLVSMSKDLGLELFVSRLCIGYFFWTFARRSSFKNGFKKWLFRI